MNTGKLNKVLVFTPNTQAQGTDGYFTNTAGTAVTLRGHVQMMSAARKMQYTELINSEVYEVEIFDNAAITKNAKVTYGSKTLYIHSIIDVSDKSRTGVKKLILYTKG